MLELRVLGPLEVRNAGELVSVAAPKQRALLALLIINANEVLSIDRILEELWGEHQPEGGAKTLRFHISKLRDALEPDRKKGDGRESVIETIPPGYLLRLGEDQLDSLIAERLIAQARRLVEEDPTAAADKYEAALALWHGSPYSEFQYQDFARADIGRLEELRLSALEERIGCDLALGHHDRVIGELERLVLDFPLRERLRGLLMTALYRSGRQSEALRTYREAAAVMGEELGIEPGPELRGLEEQILLQDAPLHPEPPPPRRRHNLPAEFSRFVGREVELADIRELVLHNRAVTLTGPGGVGKTRLAQRLGHLLVDSFADGVFLVDLGEVADPEAVASSVAAALGVDEEPNRSVEATLIDYLAHRQLLLVLDDCEVLLAVAAGLADRLLRACPEIRILATSQEALGAPGEVRWTVTPLALSAEDPRAESDAVRLFADRATLVQPGFRLTPQNVAEVAEVCRKVEGIPLAIELAAARLRMFSLADLIERLDDPLDVLTGSGSSAPSRHQTMRGALEWSYRLLESDEQAVLRHLAPFRGGFDFAGVGAVAGGVVAEQGAGLDAVTRLVDASLVVFEGPESGRYRLLETTRIFVAGLLAESGEEAACRRRHAQHYAAIADTAASGLVGPSQYRTLQMLTREQENMRAALAWARDAADDDVLLTLVGGLSRYWMARGLQQEAHRWVLPTITAMMGDASIARARVLAAGCWLAMDDGRVTDMESLVGELLVLAGDIDDPVTSAEAIKWDGNLAWLQQDLQRAAERFEESIGLLGDDAYVSVPASWLADLSITTGQPQRAAELADLLDEWDPGSGRAEQIRGEVRVLRGETREAAEHFRAAITALRAAELTRPLAESLISLGWIGLELSDVDTARSSGDEALAVARQIGSAVLEAESLELLGRASLQAGDADAARARRDESLEVIRAWKQRRPHGAATEHTIFVGKRPARSHRTL